MSLFSVGFVILILLVSGFIAYQADKLGKKLGKKRLGIRYRSLNLRPKHVAALGTVAMGVAVSFLTIVCVALLSRDAREWLQEGPGLLDKRDKLAIEVRKGEREEKSLRDRLDAIQAQLNLAQVKLATSSAEAAKADARRVKLQGIADGLQAKVDRIGGDLRASQNELARKEGSLARANAQLTTLRPQVDSALARLASTKRDLAVEKTNLAKVWSDLATANKSQKYALVQLESAKKKSFQTYQELLDLTRQVKDLTEQAKTRADDVASLKRQTADLVADRDEAERQASKARSQLVDLQGQLDLARGEAASLGAAFGKMLDGAVKTSRQEPLTFGASEEVARVVVRAGSSADDAENALAGLLRAARVAAEARGARGHQAKGGQSFEVADVFDREDPATHAPVLAEDLKRAVARRVAGQDEDQVLVATASLNAFRGEPVPLDIAVVPNPMVYRRNQLVAEARIDGSLAEDRILGQLSEFVAGRVRERASQDHMIPRANTAAPFGEIPPLDVLALVRDVKRAGRSVRVQAVAGTDTHAADPLRLEFRIR